MGKNSPLDPPQICKIMLGLLSLVLFKAVPFKVGLSISYKVLPIRLMMDCVTPKVRSNPARWTRVNSVILTMKSSILIGKRVFLMLLRTSENRFFADRRIEFKTRTKAAMSKSHSNVPSCKTTSLKPEACLASAMTPRTPLLTRQRCNSLQYFNLV